MILALDLAQSFGWCVVNRSGEYVASGHQSLPNTHRGKRLYELRKCLEELIDIYQPDWMAVEKPVSHHYGAARNLFSFAGLAELLAEDYSLGYIELNRSECYKAVLGAGNAGKVSGIVYARQFKPLLNSDDESDAVLVAMAAHKMRSANA